MRSHDTETRNMPMLYIIDGLFLHLRQHIADDLGRIVWRFPWSRGIHGNVGELGPRQRVVQVILQEVIFR